MNTQQLIDIVNRLGCPVLIEELNRYLTQSSAGEASGKLSKMPQHSQCQGGKQGQEKPKLAVGFWLD